MMKLKGFPLGPTDRAPAPKGSEDTDSGLPVLGLAKKATIHEFTMMDQERWILKCLTAF